MGEKKGLHIDKSNGDYASASQVADDLRNLMDDLPFDTSSIFVAIHNNSQGIRKANILARDSELKSQFNELIKSANDMQTAANFRLAAGIISGVTQGLMAGYQMYSSAQAGKEAMKGVEPQKQGNELKSEAKALNSSAAQLDTQAKALRTDTPAANNSMTVTENIEVSAKQNTAAQEKATATEQADIVVAEKIQSAEKKEAVATEQQQQEIIEEHLTTEAVKTKNKESSATDQSTDEVKTALTDDLEAISTAEGNKTEQKHKAEFIEDHFGSNETTENASAEAPRTAAELKAEASAKRQEAQEKTALAKEKFQEVQEINNRADSIKNTADLRNKILDGFLGQPLTAGMKFGAESFDVHAKRHETDAKRHESQSARASDAIQQAREVAQDALQKLESVDQARIDTNRSIARNLG